MEAHHVHWTAAPKRIKFRMVSQVNVVGVNIMDAQIVTRLPAVRKYTDNMIRSSF